MGEGGTVIQRITHFCALSITNVCQSVGFCNCELPKRPVLDHIDRDVEKDR